ncbi:toprim domain-containing protein [Moorella naiadis]|uniref:DUF3991 domain-containing protein n=1 Tax=Moorella naiadis (nom. illeg.) TaxID=3093670 RepID=UPI003D9CAA42
MSYLRARNYPLHYEGSGNWRLPGFGGVVVQGNHFYWFAIGKGGNAVDFATMVWGLSFEEAITELLGQPGQHQSLEPIHQPHADHEFRLPERAPDNRRVAAYLTKTRGLPSSFVGWLFAKGLLFQDGKGNCVFPCYDQAGRPRGAFLRGTASNFKGMAPGSNGRYPWHYPPETQGRLVVACESPIDALSLVSLKPYLQDHHLVSLNGLRWEALATFLGEWQKIKTVILAFDGDKPGQTAAEEFGVRLKAMQYKVALLLPPAGVKDWNAALLLSRQER